jgi:isopenicillin N synthase-like dioxygenase
MGDQEIPIIDVDKYLNQREGWEDECKKVAESFHKYGICKMRDPRVNEKDNDDYIDMVERYFDNVSKKFYAGETLKDIR